MFGSGNCLLQPTDGEPTTSPGVEEALLPKVADLRRMLVDLADEEEVTFFFMDDEEEIPFSVEVHRTVEGVVEVECKNAELSAELIDLREEAEQVDEDKERYATALRILEKDARICERDLDVVANSLEPVAALVRMRAGH